jgi:hypothetical protein
MLDLLKPGKLLCDNFYLLWKKQTLQLREAFRPTDAKFTERPPTPVRVCTGGGTSGIMPLGLVGRNYCVSRKECGE